MIWPIDRWHAATRTGKAPEVQQTPVVADPQMWARTRSVGPCGAHARRIIQQPQAAA